MTNFFLFFGLNGFVLLPLYIHELGGTEVEIGLVMGLSSAVGIVCQPLLGPWMDVIGRRPFMLVGVGLNLLAALGAAAVPAIWSLAIVRVLQGVGLSAFFVAAFSHVVDIVPPARRGWALGIYGVSGLLATALAPLVGEWIARSFGFRPLFVVLAAVTGVAGVVVWPLREARPAGTVPLRAGWAGFRGSLEDVLRLHMVVTLFFGLGSGTIFAFLPTFAESLGVRSLSLFYTAYAGAAIGVRVLGGQLIDTHGRRAVIVPSMFVQALATVVLAALGFLITRRSATPVLPVLFLAGLLSGGAHGYLYPGLAALVTDVTPEARRAAVVGLFSAMFLVGQSTGAFLFGFVAHALGYGSMWSVLGGLLLIGGALSLRLPPRGAR